MTLHAAYLRLKAQRCRRMAEDAEGWLIAALGEMADELEAKADELEAAAQYQAE